MKNTIILFVSALIALLTIALTNCKKNDLENKRTLKKLYKTYKDGSTTECTHNGQTVYCAGLNGEDAGAAIYDEDGKVIGTCNYAWGKPDAICGELTDCETIYRCEGHITVEPAVDKYGLGK